jgi:serine/threonine-protein kinase
MPLDAQLRQLLDRWDDLRDRGEAPTPEDLCRDCPERVAELRSVLRDLNALNPPDATAPEPTASPGGSAATYGDPPAAAFAGSRYRPVRFHANGGQGEVYLARDATLSREIALKRIQPRHAGRDEVVRRFVREAEVCGRLQHPGIVPVYDLGRDAEGQPFYVMRFIEGESLAAAVQRFHAEPHFDSLKFHKLLQAFVAVCNTVAYAHSRGVIHRDLKPTNAMLGRFGETLVIDWGMARPFERSEEQRSVEEASVIPSADREGSETVEGQAVGTPAYMPPEQAEGRLDELGPAADIFSLGAVLYYMLTGRPPYQGRYGRAVVELAKRYDFPRPQEVQPATPRPLEAVCLKAMARQPGDRYPTTTALAVDVEHWLADEPVSAWRESWGETTWRWARHHQILVTLAIVALLFSAAMVLAAGIILVSRERDQKAAALRAAVAARGQTLQALNTLTDDVVERLLGRRADPGPDERAYLRKVQQYYEQFAAAGGDAPEDRARRADGYFRIGCVKDRLGDRDGAEAALLTAAELQAALVAESGAADYRWNLGLTLMRLGSVRRDLGRLKEAEASWEDAQRHFAALAAADPGSAPHRAKLAEVQKNLGVAYTEDGRAAEAETATRAALEIDRRLVANFPAQPEYQNGLGADITNLANLLRETGRPEAALAEFRAARDVFVRLAADFPAPEYRVRLGIAHDNLGAMLRLMNQPRQAEAEHRAGRAVVAGLAAEFPAVPEYKQSLAASRDNLALLLVGTDRPEEAEALYRESYALRARLAADFPKVPEYAHDLAATLINMAELDRKRGDPTRALARLAEAVPHQRAARAAEPRNATFTAGYRENLKVTALALLDLGDYGPAAERVAQMLSLQVEPSADAWFAAGALGRCAERAAADTRLSAAERAAQVARFDARAFDLARRAAAAGVRDVGNVTTDPDLAALRRRPGFLDFLWELADRPAEVKRLTP